MKTAVAIKTQRGFTLIEVLLAMSILAFITLMVTQGIRRGADFKSKNQRNIDQRAILNSAMRIIERDINMAFHYQDITKEVLEEVKKSGQPSSTPPGQPNPDQPNPAPTQPPKGVEQKPKYEFKIREIPNHTNFLGEKDSLNFTNLNGTPTAGEQLAGDQQEVGYFVKNCKSLATGNSTSCLWRRTSGYVDEKIDEGGEEIVIVEGVKRFSLRYFGKQKEDWVEKWRTDEQGDDLTKNNFPEAVEVTLTIEKEKRELSAIRVIPLRFPNNIEKKAPSQNPTPNPGDGP